MPQTCTCSAHSQGKSLLSWLCITRCIKTNQENRVLSTKPQVLQLSCGHHQIRGFSFENQLRNVCIYLFIKFHCIKVVLLISWLSHFPQEAQLSLDSYLILNILQDRKCQRDPFHERTAAWVLRDKTKHLIWLFVFFFTWKWWGQRNLSGFSEVIMFTVCRCFSNYAADIKATVRGGGFSVIVFL